jgi:glutamine synthetase
VGKLITVVASYTDGRSTVESVASSATAAVTNVNDAPTGSVILTGMATQGQTLTAANTLADADGLGAISYQWKAGGTAITGATGSTLVLTEAQVDKTITVTANYTDLHGTAESITSSATVAVTNVNDLPTGSVTLTGTASQGQTLTAANTLADADGLGAISYQWKAGGTAITGATGSTLVLTEAQVGKTITVAASYTDLHGTAESVTSSATAAAVNVNDLPLGSVTLTGTATKGQRLNVANTLADADGLGVIRYQWKAGGAVITGATANALTLTDAQVGKTITVTASYTDLHGTAESVTSTATAAVTNYNNVPTGSVTITGSATQGQTLSAANTLADADGLGTISYQWQAGSTAITGATANTLTLADAQVGKIITVVASYTDLHGTAESVTSAATTAVANTNDLPTGSVAVTGAATQGETLAVANTLADADGLGTISYQWQVGGVAVSGATASTLLLTEAQVGKTITVVARYTDLHGTAESITSSSTAAVTNINDLPTGSVTINGTATKGQTLTATDTLADIDGLGAISYQWQADGASITGATTSALVLADAQVGKIITVVASYTDLHNTLETASSSATAVVTNANAAPTGSVTIAGTATKGQTLTAANTLADADGLGTISYQWHAGASAIPGATASTLTLAEAQVGKIITVVASYTDLHNTLETVTSSATAAVATNFNNLPTGSVTITGLVKQGGVLTASNNLADADGLGAISYQWKADETVIGIGSSHTLTQAEAGKAITAIANYTDNQGAAESVSSVATVADLVDNPATVDLSQVNSTTDNPKEYVAIDLGNVDFSSLGDDVVKYDSIDWGEIGWTELNWTDPSAVDVINWGDVQWSELDWMGKGADSTAINWGEIQWDEITEPTDYSAIDWGEVGWTELNWADPASVDTINWGDIDWSELDWTGKAADSKTIDWGTVQWDELTDPADYRAIDWGEVGWTEINWVDSSAVDTINWGDIDWSELDWTGKAADSTAIDWGTVQWDELTDPTDYTAIDWGEINWAQLADQLAAINWGQIDWNEIDFTGKGLDAQAINWGEIQWDELDWGTPDDKHSDASAIDWGEIDWSELASESSDALDGIDWGQIDWKEIDFKDGKGSDMAAMDWTEVDWSELGSTGKSSDYSAIDWGQIDWSELGSDDTESTDAIGWGEVDWKEIDYKDGNGSDMAAMDWTDVNWEELDSTGKNSDYSAIDWGQVDWAEIGSDDPESTDAIDWGKIDWNEIDYKDGAGSDMAAINWAAVNWPELDWTGKKSDAFYIDWGQVDWNEIVDAESDQAIADIDWAHVTKSELDADDITLIATWTGKTLAELQAG